jgi:uncharacterized SAM-binding protein YcdF (DUF218 family)
MFFILSKVFWAGAQPLSLIALFGFVTVVSTLTGRPRLALASGSLGFLLVFLCGFTTIGALLIRPLEDRFQPPSQEPEHVSAIVVLGGGSSGRVSGSRHIAELNAAGDRFVEAAALALRYPSAKVVISGGFGSLVQEGDTDATIAQRLFPSLGIASNRLVLEGESRNTAENAAFVKERLAPGGGSILLVTSGFHMPRSVGLFRRQGIDVVPWPVDYRAEGTEGFGLDLENPPENLTTTTVAIREWIGLVAYRMTGQIDDLLPGPIVP